MLLLIGALLAPQYYGEQSSAMQPSSAITWVDPDLRAAFGSVYNLAVAGMRALRVCQSSQVRPTASHSRDYTKWGGTLIVAPHLRRVPELTSKVGHFMAASNLGWPGDRLMDIDLAPDLQCAAAHSLHTSADNRRSTMHQWTAWCETLRVFSLWIHKRHAPSYATTITADTNPACMAASLDAIDYRDKDVVRLSVIGFPLTGCPIADSGAYKAIPTTPIAMVECKLQQYVMRNEQRATNWQGQVVQRTRMRALQDPAAATAIIVATQKEVDKAIVSKPFHSIGALRAELFRLTGNNLCVWVLQRFARWQDGRGDYRMIDDGRSSHTNTATVMEETIVCPSFDFALLVARVQWLNLDPQGYEPQPMHLSLLDFTGAYRYVLNAQPHLAVWPVAHPHGVTAYHFMYGHPFGLVSSVVNFNRYAEAHCAIARGYGVAVDHFFDDLMVVDFDRSGDTATAMVQAVVTGTGGGPEPGGRHGPARAPRFDPKKHKPASRVNVALGVTVDLSCVHTHGYVKFTCLDSRRHNILKLWRAARITGKMSPADALILLGKTGFALSATFGRVGRAATLCLVQRGHHDSFHGFTPAMESAYQFFSVLFGENAEGQANLPPLIISTTPSAHRPLLVYTDASYRRKRPHEDSCSSEDVHVPRMGMVVYDPTAWDAIAQLRGILLYADAVPDASVMSTFSPLKVTYIAQLEALAALTVYAAATTWRNHGIDLRDRTVNHFIDNTVAQAAFVHGYARTTDLAKLSNCLHLTAAGLNTRPFFDYVPSLANIADEPSRGIYRSLEAMHGHRVQLPIIGAQEWSAPLDRWIFDRR